jgi:hypothetical protein
VAKDIAGWKIEKPRAVQADGGAVPGLLSAVGTARLTSFVGDASTNLAKYGLAKPAITFHAQLSGGKSAELMIGKKDGAEYYARDASRADVFRVNESLYTALNKKFFDLRDKALLHAEATQFVRAEIRNAKGTTVCNQSSSGGWLVEQPAGERGKAPAGNPPECPSFMPTLQQAQALEIYDLPAPAIAARLAKPAAQVALTDKSGNKTEIQFSAADGNFVYARTSSGAQIFKLEKSILDDLNFKGLNLRD